MTVDLARRASAEAVGTGLLVAVIVGSGIAAQQIATDDPGFQLLAVSAATAGGLMALILTFAPISGGHLNPVVTLAERAFGRVTTRTAITYIVAQTLGGVTGALAANVMFDLSPLTLASQARSSPGLWFAEVIATFGLLTVILSIVATGRTATVPYAVAGYIAAGHWFTSSTSFANPAVTVARTTTDTFAGIAPASAGVFVTAQLTGGAVAVALVWFLHPALKHRDAHPSRHDLDKSPKEPHHVTH